MVWKNVKQFLFRPICLNWYNSQLVAHCSWFFTFIVLLFGPIISLLLNYKTKASFVDFFLSESENVGYSLESPLRQVEGCINKTAVNSVIAF